MKFVVIPIFLLLALCSISSLCQTFTPGRIEGNDQKKSGLLSFNPYKAKDKVLFKSSKNDVAEEVKAGDVEEFYLDQYKARFVSMTDTTTKQTVFAQVIADGAVMLANSGNSYFLRKGDKRLQINFASDKNKANLIRGRGLVKYFLSDCAGDEIEKKLANFSPSSLRAAVARYNECTQSNVMAARPRVEFGLVAGVSMPTLTFDRPEYNYFDGQPGFKGGFMMDVVPARFEARIVFSLQAVLLQNNFKEKPNSPLAPLNIDLNHLTFRLPIAAKFFFKPGREGLFFMPGLSPLIVLNSNTDTNLIKFNTAGFSGFVGAGYEMRMRSGLRIVYTFRYENDLMPTTVSGAFVPSTSRMSSLQFDVGIKF